MRFFLTLVVVCCVLFGIGRPDEEEHSAKAALQELGEFIGNWKGTGGPEKRRPEAGETWQEVVSWSWRFKGDDAWLVMNVKNGKYFKSGELRYLADKKRYRLAAVTLDDKKQSFEGEYKDGYLTLERIDPDSKETQRITMNTLGDGVRFIYRYAHKAEGRTLFTKDYQVACTKEGESFAAKDKKPECVVTGGLGTMQISYKGVSYYVCCSGCRDAFNENPEKFIKEFEAKKKKK
jgi:hypothetical protein